MISSSTTSYQQFSQNCQQLQADLDELKMLPVSRDFMSAMKHHGKPKKEPTSLFARIGEFLNRLFSSKPTHTAPDIDKQIAGKESAEKELKEKIFSEYKEIAATFVQELDSASDTVGRIAPNLKPTSQKDMEKKAAYDQLRNHYTQVKKIEDQASKLFQGEDLIKWQRIDASVKGAVSLSPSSGLLV